MFHGHGPGFEDDDAEFREDKEALLILLAHINHHIGRKLSLVHAVGHTYRILDQAGQVAICGSLPELDTYLRGVFHGSDWIRGHELVQ